MLSSQRFGTRVYETMATMHKYNSSGWPKTIDTLVAGDIFVGAYFGPNNRRSLLGWIDKIGSNFLETYEGKIFRDVLLKNLVAAGSSRPKSRLVAIHNDHGGLSNEQLAEAWNQTLIDLGYDV